MSDLIHVKSASLDRLREWGGEKLLSQMLQLFIENVGERLSQIDGGMADDDIDPVERGVHSLKSSAANVGAETVSLIAQEMESAAENSEWDRIRELRPQLGEALDAALIELKSVLEGLPE